MMDELWNRESKIGLSLVNRQASQNTNIVDFSGSKSAGLFTVTMRLPHHIGS